MNVTTTQTKYEFRKSNYGNRAIVYVDSGLNDMLDKEIFMPHVSNLDYESKAWNSICRSVNKLISTAIKQHLGADYQVTFSRKAGCNCGCSPGYIVKRHGDYTQPGLRHTDMWMDVEFDEQELETFRNNNFSKFHKQHTAELNSQLVG